jgi:hypothetical protein
VKNTSRRFPSHPLAGYVGVIALLIVVVIILAVMLNGHFAQDPKTKLPQAELYIDRSADTACSLNRTNLKTQVTQFQTMNPGAPLSTEILKRKLSFPQCPKGGAYMIGADGTVYCTKHFPPPIQELQNSMPQSPAGSAQPLIPSAAPPGQ